MNAIIENSDKTQKTQRNTYDGRVFLKVKLKSLAAEAKIIRHEERKGKAFRPSLRKHRTGIVRQEARHSLLAYGFLRGLAYRDIEPVARCQPEWPKVEAMARKYGIIHVRDASVSPLQEQGENEQMMARLQAWRVAAAS